MQPLVSFIVPVYNCEKYLKKCIDSIIFQSNVNFEVILIDDGSTDSSAAICDSYQKQDKRIRSYHVENGGPSNARNFGIEKATGEYLMFIDSDDWIENNLTDILSKGCTADLIFFGYNIHKEDSCKTIAISGNDSLVSREDIDKQLSEIFEMKGQPFGFTWNKFFKTSIIKEHNIQFCASLKHKEDELFTIEFCKYINLLYVSKECPYHYRILQNSLSHREMRYHQLDILSENILSIISSTHHLRFRSCIIRRLKSYLYMDFKEKFLLDRDNAYNAFSKLDDFMLKYSHNGSESFALKMTYLIPSKRIRYQLLKFYLKLA